MQIYKQETSNEAIYSTWENNTSLSGVEVLEMASKREENGILQKVKPEKQLEAP
jgi:hypothetical protein